MEIYVAIDIRGGKCVRLTQGDFARETVYFDDPLEAARHWLEQGARWIHVVDLDGARSGERLNASVVRKIIRASDRAQVQVSGGLRTLDHIREVLSEGAARAVLGTAAVRDPDVVRRVCAAHPGQVAVGVDARDGHVMVQGWEEGSSRSVTEVADLAVNAGAAAIIHTDIGVDGTLAHPNVDATRALVLSHGDRVPVIASGGVSSLDDVRQLRDAGAHGVIIGRSLYTGALNLREAIDVADETVH